MLTKFKPASKLDREINRAILELNNHLITSPEYGETMTKIDKLQKMKANSANFRPSADTLILASTNLLGILMILQHEHLHPITSKAVGLLIKTR